MRTLTPEYFRWGTNTSFSGDQPHLGFCTQSYLDCVPNHSATRSCKRHRSCDDAPELWAHREFVLRLASSWDGNRRITDHAGKIAVDVVLQVCSGVPSDGFLLRLDPAAVDSIGVCTGARNFDGLRAELNV